MTCLGKQKQIHVLVYYSPRKTKIVSYRKEGILKKKLIKLIKKDKLNPIINVLKEPNFKNDNKEKKI